MCSAFSSEKHLDRLADRQTCIMRLSMWFYEDHQKRLWVYPASFFMLQTYTQRRLLCGAGVYKVLGSTGSTFNNPYRIQFKSSKYHKVDGTIIWGLHQSVNLNIPLFSSGAVIFCDFQSSKIFNKYMAKIRKITNFGKDFCMGLYEKVDRYSSLYPQPNEKMCFDTVKMCLDPSFLWTKYVLGQL